MSAPALRDAARLAVGTLTVLPVRPPGTVDRQVGGWAMTLAPGVGAALAVLGGTTLWLLGLGPVGLPAVGRLLPAGLGEPWAAHPYVAATVVVSVLALATRAMHLDGLADTADGLGSGRPAEQALEVMRRGDVGPFGVVTLVLVLLLQVASLAVLLGVGMGTAGLAFALVVSRLALPLACVRGIPAARAEGLGHLVAGAVGRWQLVLSAALAVAVLVPLGLVSVGFHAVGPGVVARAAVVAVLALLVAAAVVRRALRRFGGVTGDVLGAAVELTFTTVLVALTLVA